MNFFGKDFELFFFFLVRTEERCWFTWTLRLENSFENKLALYTKISETGGRKGNAYYQKGLSFKKTTVQMYLQHLF